MITEASPESRILLVTSFGRPTPEDVEEIIAMRPDLKEFVTGTGMCDWYNPAGEIVPESFATFSSIIDGYEAEQARVCAAVPQCSTDGGAGTSFEDLAEHYSDDYTHLNATGLAAFAEHMWPVVEAQLASGITCPCLPISDFSTSHLSFRHLHSHREPPNPIVAVVVVILTVVEDDLQVLLIKRSAEPFREYWALPGGLLEPAESLDRAAARKLLDETGVSDVYLEQLYTFGELSRGDGAQAPPPAKRPQGRNDP